jgi:hypothetical protein
MRHRAPATRRDAVLNCVFIALVTLVCAGMLTAAALAPAPAAVLPVVVITCLGFAMAVASELPATLEVLRRAHDTHAVDALLRELEALPEVEHPLGL